MKIVSIQNIQRSMPTFGSLQVKFSPEKKDTFERLTSEWNVPKTVLGIQQTEDKSYKTVIATEAENLGIEKEFAETLRDNGITVMLRPYRHTQPVEGSEN